MNEVARLADFIRTSCPPSLSGDDSREYAQRKVVVTERTLLGSVDVKFVSREALPGYEVGYRPASNPNPETYFHIIEQCSWAIPFTGGFVDYLYETAGL